MKKGRHRRFEEARKLKQSGPSAFDLGFGEQRLVIEHRREDDEYAALAEKYGVTFDDDEDDRRLNLRATGAQPHLHTRLIGQ